MNELFYVSCISINKNSN